VNFLAHLYLADDSPASMVGNLLPDMHRGRLPTDLAPQVEAGVVRHRKVDAYTDTHPLFERSRDRLRPRHGRYTGIIVDVLYDHVLSVCWRDYADEPLADFIARAYVTLEQDPGLMPPRMQAIIRAMIDQDWLSTYVTVEGIGLTLRRLSARLNERFGRQIALDGAVDELVEQYEGFTQDFAAFFPELMAYVGVSPRRRP